MKRGRSAFTLAVVGVVFALSGDRAAGQGQNVRLVGHYDTPGNAHGVCVTGGLAYVAYNGWMFGSWAGLKIIDVSNPISFTTRNSPAPPIVINEASRTISTNLITVRWDINANERILSLELNSAPGVNLTSRWGNQDFTGSSYVANGPGGPIDETASGTWQARLLDPQGIRAEVVLQSHRSGFAPVTTVYRFQNDSALLSYQRTFHFSIQSWTQTGSGLIPYLWYMRGVSLPFTYTKPGGQIGSGTAAGLPGPISDWDGRWGDMVQIAYFHGVNNPPCRLYGDTDGGPAASNINAWLSSPGTFTTDITVRGGLFLHESGLAAAAIEAEYAKFVADISAPVAPSNVSPTLGATNINLSPTLVSSAFGDPVTTHTHAASQWQISAANDFSSTPPVVWDSGPTATNLTSVSVPANVLRYAKVYFWRVRHQDSSGLWSFWSVPTFFQTASSPSSRN